MRPLSESEIRTSFINASKSEQKSVALPADLGELDWEKRDFLGWRDAKLPLVGYVVVEIDGVPTGVILRQTEARPTGRTQCVWCADVELPNAVVMFSAKRAGAAGRRGDVVGTLVCERFECNVNARRTPKTAYLGFDVDAARQRRIDMLRENVEAFVRGIRDQV
ncbi:FBP domain-containing protein [Microbacterium fluvii]|uniref:FBP domain-containing protein n=1 Tax=Microbacterium fluvii TaxID=415215 RepID=A0ABW2HDC8_9MICO|nr:FBP domain-containing protein [Microbacterium fluvii]MCU4672748.1 FBP domain-containing protein [Microbacterium fluvii]